MFLFCVSFRGPLFACVFANSLIFLLSSLFFLLLPHWLYIFNAIVLNVCRFLWSFSSFVKGAILNKCNIIIIIIITVIVIALPVCQSDRNFKNVKDADQQTKVKEQDKIPKGK